MTDNINYFIRVNDYVDKCRLNIYLLKSLFVHTVGGCRDDQYECLSGLCIISVWRCDVIVDCPGGDDEQGCGEL